MFCRCIFLLYFRWTVDRNVDRQHVVGLGAVLGPMLAILGRSWASTGGPGPLLGPMLVVLGRSWALCWRSWAALGTYVGGPEGSRPYVGGPGVAGAEKGQAPSAGMAGIAPNAPNAGMDRICPKPSTHVFYR